MAQEILICIIKPVIKKIIDNFEQIKNFFTKKSTKYENLCIEINEHLYKNYKLYYENCPFLDKETTGIVETENWYSIQETMIAPNNNKILALIEDNENIIPSKYKSLYLKMKQHINLFNIHIKNRNIYYGNHRFPDDFANYIANIVKLKNRKQINKIANFINRNLIICNNNIDKIVCYGSILFNKIDSNSDVDILILLNTDNPKEVSFCSSHFYNLNLNFKNKFKTDIHLITFIKSEENEFEKFVGKLYAYEEI